MKQIKLDFCKKMENFFVNFFQNESQAFINEKTRYCKKGHPLVLMGKESFQKRFLIYEKLLANLKVLSEKFYAKIHQQYQEALLPVIKKEFCALMEVLCENHLLKKQTTLAGMIIDFEYNWLI